MITIFYHYFSTKERRWLSAEKSFTNVRKAVAFCWAIKKDTNLLLDGWGCYDHEDSDYMSRCVNIQYINKH